MIWLSRYYLVAIGCHRALEPVPRNFTHLPQISRSSHWRIMARLTPGHSSCKSATGPIPRRQSSACVQRQRSKTALLKASWALIQGVGSGIGRVALWPRPNPLQLADVERVLWIFPLIPSVRDDRLHVFVVIWSTRNGHLYVSEVIWSGRNGHRYVLAVIWSARNDHLYVVEVIWSDRNGHPYVLEIIWIAPDHRKYARTDAWSGPRGQPDSQMDLATVSPRFEISLA